MMTMYYYLSAQAKQKDDLRNTQFPNLATNLTMYFLVV